MEQTKKELLEKIKEAERQLRYAEQESVTWGQDKYRDFMLLELAKLHVKNHKEAVAKLHKELENYEST